MCDNTCFVGHLHRTLCVHTRARAPWAVPTIKLTPFSRFIPLTPFLVTSPTRSVPILGTFAAASQLTLSERALLVGVYSPYLIVPLLLVW